MIGQPDATLDGEGMPVHAVVQVGEEITDRRIGPAGFAASSRG